VREAAAVMAEEGTPMDDHRASASYRSAMLGQSLLRLYAQQLATEGVSA
jgi:xanthine dehydrogenase small subunit